MLCLMLTFNTSETTLVTFIRICKDSWRYRRESTSDLGKDSATVGTVLLSTLSPQARGSRTRHAAIPGAGWLNIMSDKLSEIYFPFEDGDSSLKTADTTTV